MNTKKMLTVLVMLVVLGLARAAGDLPTMFSNRGSIGNTRHNMTQRQITPGVLADGDPSVNGPYGEIMNAYRNDYQEVCVYCHTPHGANANVTLPLWNRTLKATTYTTYDLLRTSTVTQVVTQPGAASLSCLSCHDGQTAVDSIINMPGSGRFLASQATSQSNAFLDTWRNPIGAFPSGHMTLSATGCLACHAPGAGPVGGSATDFTVAAIGTDLRNDHVVGVTYPALAAATDNFKRPVGTKGNATFFDVDGDTKMDKGELRVYDGKVECASCHDPHGVPSGGPNSTFQPTFLRASNAASALCLTCHSK